VRSYILDAKLALHDLRNEFKKGGCVNVFVNETLDALNPISPRLSSLADPAVAYMSISKYNAALSYAASRSNFLGGTGLLSVSHEVARLPRFDGLRRTLSPPPSGTQRFSMQRRGRTSSVEGASFIR